MEYNPAKEGSRFEPGTIYRMANGGAARCLIADEAGATFETNQGFPLHTDHAGCIADCFKPTVTKEAIA